MESVKPVSGKEGFLEAVLTIRDLYQHPCFKSEEIFFKVSAQIRGGSVYVKHPEYPYIYLIIRNIKVLYNAMPGSVKDAARKCISEETLMLALAKGDISVRIAGAKEELDRVYSVVTSDRG